MTVVELAEFVLTHEIDEIIDKCEEIVNGENEKEVDYD